MRKYIVGFFIGALTVIGGGYGVATVGYRPQYSITQTHIDRTEVLKNKAKAETITAAEEQELLGLLGDIVLQIY